MKAAGERDGRARGGEHAGAPGAGAGAGARRRAGVLLVFVVILRNAIVVDVVVVVVIAIVDLVVFVAPTTVLLVRRSAIGVYVRRILDNGKSRGAAAALASRGERDAPPLARASAHAPSLPTLVILVHALILAPALAPVLAVALSPALAPSAG